MCGICGFINLDGRPADGEVAARMNQTLVHRGPDDAGVFTDRNVALAHRRLSIVDLQRGRQPMRTADDKLTIVYNGEIYNHRELREQLSFPAAHYRTTCDTETLLLAYQQKQSDCLLDLRGMFALAIHDAEDGALFLARDRLGIKPLYYYRSQRVFAFASEIKALLAHPDVAARINLDKLPVQLALKYTLDDETLFAGVKKLPPGHFLRVHPERCEIRKYWDLSFTPKQEFATLDEAAAEFRVHFHDSVRARLMSDVPLGVFLSGGIDSSVIAASMSRLVDAPIQAFSVAFAERECNELPYSREVARQLGADVHEVVVSPEDFFSAWPRLLYHEDEPIAHPSSIPLHFVSMLAAKHVKVVLTGEGADELMGGYERYYQTLINLRYGRWLPNRLRSLARPLIDALPDRFFAKRKVVRTALYLPCDVDALYLDNYAAFSRADLWTALRPGMRGPALEGMYAAFGDLMAAADADELLDKILAADIKTYLLELLMKQDQMSMSASLESRVPFLDHRLVDFVCRLPTQYKLRGFATKRVLRRALGDTIPRRIVHRAKKGFPTPVADWFRGAYAKRMRDLLLSDKSLSVEYIDPSYTRRILDRHAAGQWNHVEQIWTLGNLELWLRIFLDGQDPATIWPAREEALACACSG